MDEQISYVTRDGRQVSIRPITPDDAGRLVDLYYRLSETTRRLRFHSMGRNVPLEMIEQEARWLSDLDPAKQAALVATVEEEGEERIVAVARLARSEEDPLHIIKKSGLDFRAETRYGETHVSVLL